MNEPIPLILSWSGGKDSGLALHALKRDPRYRLRGLLTSVNRDYGRISMHGVRETLLDCQADAIGLPLHKVWLSARSSNEEYETAMAAQLEMFKQQGIHHMAFGDLFLEDIRRYREAQLARAGMEAVFPLWLKPTPALAREFIESGFGATLCCVDGEKLGPEYAGREFDSVLLGDLPAGVDPCGENGEFHTFVHRSPDFSASVRCILGERVTREGRFHYCDLLPEPEDQPVRQTRSEAV
ncbi:MAG TPA: ATP-binding protein, partial [Gammaproteobacteria bacterium]|nr:ATP-binding protein [Gammaproteobacteria bacterium]